jgi:hypothetical protein
MTPLGLGLYAGICGWTLARAHARSGDPVAIAAYLGEGDQFDRSMVDFAKRYADRNQLDYQAFAEAIRSGRLKALKASTPESFHPVICDRMWPRCGCTGYELGRLGQQPGREARCCSRLRTDFIPSG